MKSRLLRKMSSLCSHGKQHLCENLIAGNEHTDTRQESASCSFSTKSYIKKSQNVYCMISLWMFCKWLKCFLKGVQFNAILFFPLQIHNLQIT